MDSRTAAALPGDLARAALSMIDNMIVVTRADGTIVYVNDAFTRTTGFSEDEALGGTPRVLRSGVQDEAFYERLWAQVLAGRRWDGEIVNRRKDGSLYTDRMTITPLLDASGSISHFVAVKRDVTEHVAALAAESPTGLAHLDASCRLVYGNRRLEQLLELSYEALLGHAWLAALQPDDAELLRVAVGAAAGGTEGSLIVTTSDGRRSVQVHVGGLDLGEGSTAGVVATFEDITRQVVAERELERREAFVRTVLNSIETPTVVVDATGTIRAGNAAWTASWDEPSLTAGVDRTYWSVCEDDAVQVVPDPEVGRAALMSVLGGAGKMHTPEYTTQDGRWWELNVTPMRAGDGGAVLVHTDVTVHHQLQEVLRTRSLTDPLTGLANRAALDEHATHALARADRSGIPLTVLFLDLDRFKPINDAHGHEAGDLVLRTCADRIRGAVRGGDIPARVGGDEFVVLCENVPEGQTDLVLARIAAAVEKPIDLPNGSVVAVGASVGVARATGGRSLDDALRAADEAMYAVKRARGGDATTR